MTYWLSGQMGTELTNASTTGLLDTRTMTGRPRWLTLSACQPACSPAYGRPASWLAR